MNGYTLKSNNDLTSASEELKNVRNANHLYSTAAEKIEKEYNDLKEKSKKKTKEWHLSMFFFVESNKTDEVKFFNN